MTQAKLISRSWIVFIHAILVAAESIAIEALTTGAGIPALLLAGVGVPLSGAMLAAAAIRIKGAKNLLAVFSAWRILMPGSAFTAIGIYAWYDSVNTVGAAKEGILAGPLETIVILLLARLFLREKLGSFQLLGVAIAISGFFIAVASGGSGIGGVLTYGDIEAIISAASFGAGIILVTKLTEKHSPLSITSGVLLVSGIMLLLALSLGGWQSMNNGYEGGDAYLVILFAFLPLAAALTYVIGLDKIGASLTSTIGSFAIILVLVFQLAEHYVGNKVILPQNTILALSGAVLAVLGVYFIHLPPRGGSGHDMLPTKPPV